MLHIPHLVLRTILKELIAGPLSRSQVIPASDKALVYLQCLSAVLPVFLEVIFFSSTSRKQFFKIVFLNSLDL